MLDLLPVILLVGSQTDLANQKQIHSFIFIVHRQIVENKTDGQAQALMDRYGNYSLMEVCFIVGDEPG